MDITLGFFAYAILFRLAIIAVGTLSIFLGYRLFIKDPIGKGRSSASAEAGDFKLTLKNFWPGTYFALFGTAIIGLMLWQGNPALVIKELEGKTGEEDKTASREIVLRGEDNDNIDRYWQALSDPNLPLASAAQPISRIATRWQQEQRTGEALAMARLAVRIDDDNADYLALFASLLWDNGERDKALQVMKKAAEIDESYKSDLAKLQENTPR